MTMPQNSVNGKRRGRHGTAERRPQRSERKPQNVLTELQSHMQRRETRLSWFDTKVVGCFDGIVSETFETDKRTLHANKPSQVLVKMTTANQTVHTATEIEHKTTAADLKAILDDSNQPDRATRLIGSLLELASVFNENKFENWTDPDNSGQYIRTFDKSMAVFKANTVGSDPEAKETHEIRFHGTEMYQQKAITVNGVERNVCISFGPVVDLIYYRHSDRLPDTEERNQTVELLIFPTSHAASITAEIIPPVSVPPVNPSFVKEFKFPNENAWINKDSYIPSICEAVMDLQAGATKVLKDDETELRAFEIKDTPHITAAYLFNRFPYRRMVDVGQGTGDTQHNHGLAMKHVHTVISDIAKLQTVRVMMASIAAIIYTRTYNMIASRTDAKEITSIGNHIAHFTMPILTDKEIIHQCDRRADSMINSIKLNNRDETQLKLSTEMHKLIMSTVILTDYIGELYGTMYNMYISQYIDSDRADVTTDMINQMYNINWTCTESVSLVSIQTPFLFGNRLLVRCMIDQKVAVQPKSEASWGRAARNTEVVNNVTTEELKKRIDGDTAMASVRSTRVHPLSISSEGYSWIIDTLYEVRSPVFMKSGDLIMQKQTSKLFKWLEAYTIKLTSGQQIKTDQKTSVSIQPNITTKLRVTVNLPFRFNERFKMVCVAHTKNTLPSIPRA